MNIQLNGEDRQVRGARTLAELITELNLDGRRLAVEYNGEIVPQSERENRQLADGDRVEIVHAIGGGQGSRSFKSPQMNANKRKYLRTFACICGLFSS